ncbi:MAG TPA: acetylornithine deacetylase [Burkholderiales bacterium]|nr:acetylornithine deacetylase [Burkholderiales bacterium]
MQSERDYLPFLEELIGFATVSADSNLSLIDYAEALLEAHGYATTRTWNEERDKANLLARIGPDTAGGIALAGHTDVVPVSGQDWHSDPFCLLHRDGKFTGRGTSDMKGFIAMALSAAVSVDPRRLKKPLHLIFTYDEEIGCLGAMALQERLRTMPDKPRFALIGEPTGMQLVTAHKGIQNIATRVRGRPAHSSRPDLGASAIAFAARFIAGIERVLPRDSDPSYDPPTATFNIGTIRGGEAVNIIPEWCELRWEFRHLPEQDPGQILAELRSLSDDLCRAMPGITEETRIRASVPGLVPGANRDVVTELQRFLEPPEPRVTAVPFVTEGGLFQQAGIPSVICGPGLLEQAHQPNEWVSVSAMDEYRTFLAQVIAAATEQ